MTLKILNLNVKLGNKKILDNISLTFEEGKIYFILGPNGSGKSTLCKAIMGVGNYKIEGKVCLDNKDITKLKPWERAKLGIFLAYQYPIEIPEVKYRTFLANVYENFHGNLENYEKKLEEILKVLEIDEEYLNRGINEGFSGGERKKFEILQMLLLEPKYIFLDEVDSGIDFDSLKIISKAIKMYKNEHPNSVITIVTHHGGIAKYIEPDSVIVLKNGKIVKIGDKRLFEEIKKDGFESI